MTDAKQHGKEHPQYPVVKEDKLSFDWRWFIIGLVIVVELMFL